MRFLTIAICCAFPLAAFILSGVGSAVFGEGLRLIFMGTVTALGSLLGFLWNLLIAILPFAGAVAASYLVFNHKALFSEKRDWPEYLCAGIAAISTLIIAYSASLILPVAMIITAFLAISTKDFEPENQHKKVGNTVYFLFVFAIAFVLSLLWRAAPDESTNQLSMAPEASTIALTDYAQQRRDEHQMHLAAVENLPLEQINFRINKHVSSGVTAETADARTVVVQGVVGASERLLDPPVLICESDGLLNTEHSVLHNLSLRRAESMCAYVIPTANARWLSGEVGEASSDVRAEDLYRSSSSDAITRDDAAILPFIEADPQRAQSRRWLMNDAINARGFPHSEGGEEIDASGYLRNNFHCRDGELISSSNLSDVTEALARRVCVLRVAPSR